VCKRDWYPNSRKNLLSSLNRNGCAYRLLDDAIIAHQTRELPTMVVTKPSSRSMSQLVTILAVTTVLLCVFAYLAPIEAMFVNLGIMLASLCVSVRNETLWSDIAISVMLAAVPSSVICVWLLGA